MPIPNFDNKGELPEGVHQATIDEVLARFGRGLAQRQTATANLRRIYELSKATGKLERLIIFGSYVTAKSSPNDVDVVLVMSDDFDVTACKGESRKLFEHEEAEREFGASVFWIRPSLLLLNSLQQFIEHWQIKRDRGRRGIVEVRP